MKKIFIIPCALFVFSAFTFSKEFKPSLHTQPSVRQQGFGGFYTTDVSRFEGIYSNPAMLGLKKKHSLFPAIDVRAAGLFMKAGDIAKAISNEDTEKLGQIIKENKGIQLGFAAEPLLSFGHVADWGLGWAFNTQMFVNTSVPSVALSDIKGGVESVFRIGYGFSILNFDMIRLSVGATAKGFAQLATAYNGSVLDLIDTIASDFTQLPAYFSAGFSLDVGVMCTLFNSLSFSAVWYDAFSRAFVAESTFGDFNLHTDYSKALDSKLALGVAFQIPVGWSKGVISSFKVMCDYRNLFSLFHTLGRNPILELSCGTEFVLGNILSLRFGMSEMYPAAGLGLGFGTFKLDFAVYGKELGLEPGSSPCLNASLFIGFTY